jgi:EAL domain-containing protein (putative c-di-GMP-specific phosphodiesterase class I)
VGDHELRVTSCVGVAIRHTHGSSSTLVGNADAALSYAKSAGTGEYRLYDAEMRRHIEDRLLIETGLRTALRAGHLRLEYQPILNLCDRHMVGCEALLRWTHPDRGNLSPAEFIPIAEQSGLIVPIGQWVLETACADMLALQRDSGLRVSVNASARQLIAGGFADMVEQVVDSIGLPASALTIEVTESAFMADIDPIRTALERLRSRGIRVAIDDFGTGYSSLARLLRLPVDVIKLDRAFVDHIDVRAQARGMAAAILQLGAAIGAMVVAEGIETAPEAATLMDLGYTRGQGFLFARPMPLDGLLSFSAPVSSRADSTTLGSHSSALSKCAM